jgi:hypothetical protein
VASVSSLIIFGPYVVTVRTQHTVVTKIQRIEDTLAEVLYRRRRIVFPTRVNKVDQLVFVDIRVKLHVSTPDAFHLIETLQHRPMHQALMCVVCC